MGHAPIDDESDAPTTVIRAGSPLAEDLRRAAQEAAPASHAPSAAHASHAHGHHEAPEAPIALAPSRPAHAAVLAFVLVFFGIPLLWASGYARGSWMDGLGERWFSGLSAAPAAPAPHPAEPVPAG